jgi:hypothetical protein
MRTTIAGVPLACALLAGTLALAGCGDEAAGGDDDFCAGLARVTDTLDARSDAAPTSAEGRAAVEALGQLDPPPELAGDYATFVVFLEDAAAGTDPEPGRVGEWIAAVERLDVYAREECGLERSG